MGWEGLRARSGGGTHTNQSRLHWFWNKADSSDLPGAAHRDQETSAEPGHSQGPLQAREMGELLSWGREKGTKRRLRACSKSQKGLLRLRSSDCPWGEAGGGSRPDFQKLLGIPGVQHEAL